MGNFMGDDIQIPEPEICTVYGKVYTFLTLVECLLRLLALRDVRRDTYKELVSRSIRVQGLFNKNGKDLPGILSTLMVPLK